MQREKRLKRHAKRRIHRAKRLMEGVLGEIRNFLVVYTQIPAIL
jgi:hypothetical protein